MVEDRHLIDQALKDGVRDAMIRHKKAGLPVVIYREGQIVWVMPEDLGFYSVFHFAVARICGASLSGSPREPEGFAPHASEIRASTKLRSVAPDFTIQNLLRTPGVSLGAPLVEL